MNILFCLKYERAVAKHLVCFRLYLARFTDCWLPPAAYFLAFAPKSMEKRRFRGLSPKNPAGAGLRLVCLYRPLTSPRLCSPETAIVCAPVYRCIPIRYCSANSSPALAPVILAQQRIGLTITSGCLRRHTLCRRLGCFKIPCLSSFVPCWITDCRLPPAAYFLAVAPKSMQKRRFRGGAPKNPLVRVGG